LHTTYTPLFPSVLTQTVNPAATTTALTSSAIPSIFAQNVVLTATVSPSTATGTVTFKDGSTSLGTGTLSGGTATLALSTLATASHSLTAVYGGDINDGGSTSPVLTQTVNPAATTTALSSSANRSIFGQNAVLTATVSPSTATGTVTFKDGSVAVRTALWPKIEGFADEVRAVVVA